MPTRWLSLRWPLPTLLLGLLALLLWGQCALLLPGSPTPPPALTGEVSSTDSLRVTPSTLFLTLRLRNTFREPVTVQDVRGSLRFGKLTFPFSASPALRNRQLLAFEHLTQRVAIPLALDINEVVLLRTALSAAYLSGDARPTLHWRVRYARAAGRPIRAGRTSPYLPVLGQHQAKP